MMTGLPCANGIIIYCTLVTCHSQCAREMGQADWCTNWWGTFIRVGTRCHYDGMTSIKACILCQLSWQISIQCMFMREDLTGPIQVLKIIFPSFEYFVQKT